MKRGLLIGVSGAALFIAGLSGCSSDNSSSSETTGANTTANATAGAGNATVTIDGKDQDISGTVVCSSMGGNMNIAIGEATTGITAVISEDDSPAVRSVALGNIDGVTMGFTEGAGQGDATAEKDGDTYRVKGTATGVDMANPMQPVNKPFELEVTCP